MVSDSSYFKFISSRFWVLLVVYVSFTFLPAVALAEPSECTTVVSQTQRFVPQPRNTPLDLDEKIRMLEKEVIEAIKLHRHPDPFEFAVSHPMTDHMPDKFPGMGTAGNAFDAFHSAHVQEEMIRKLWTYYDLYAEKLALRLPQEKRQAAMGLIAVACGQLSPITMTFPNLTHAKSPRKDVFQLENFGDDQAFPLKVVLHEAAIKGIFDLINSSFEIIGRDGKSPNLPPNLTDESRIKIWIPALMKLGFDQFEADNISMRQDPLLHWRCCGNRRNLSCYGCLNTFVFPYGLNPMQIAKDNREQGWLRPKGGPAPDVDQVRAERAKRSQNKKFVELPVLQP